MQKVLTVIKPIVFYLSLFLICLAFSAHALGYDYDLWARLIVGKAVFQTGHILTHDFLSYTPTHKWIDHEWGASVVIYAFQKLFGANGIIYLQAILMFLIFAFNAAAFFLFSDTSSGISPIISTACENVSS